MRRAENGSDPREGTRPIPRGRPDPRGPEYQRARSTSPRETNAPRPLETQETQDPRATEGRGSLTRHQKGSKSPFDHGEAGPKPSLGAENIEIIECALHSWDQ